MDARSATASPAARVRADGLIATVRTAPAASTERVHAAADDQRLLGTRDTWWTAAAPKG